MADFELSGNWNEANVHLEQSELSGPWLDQGPNGFAVVELTPRGVEEDALCGPAEGISSLPGQGSVVVCADDMCGAGSEDWKRHQRGAVSGSDVIGIGPAAGWVDDDVVFVSREKGVEGSRGGVDELKPEWIELEGHSGADLGEREVRPVVAHQPMFGIDDEEIGLIAVADHARRRCSGADTHCLSAVFERPEAEKRERPRRKQGPSLHGAFHGSPPVSRA